MPSYPTYANDQLASVDLTKPLDNIPEADAPGWFRYIQTWTKKTFQVSMNDNGTLKTGIVATGMIADSAVTTAKINNSAVTTAKIADANVTTAKIANGAITVAKLAAGVLPVLAYKTASTVFSNTTTLQSDSELKVAVAANEVWHIKWFVFWSRGASAAGIKFAVTGPASPTEIPIYSVSIIDRASNGIKKFGTSLSGYGEEIGSSAGSGSGMDIAEINATIFNGVNAGDVALQYAQFSAQVNSTSVIKGSFMQAFKLA